jgi:DNA-directed RNA polymerase
MNQKLLEQQFVGCVNNAEVVIAGFAEALGNLRFSRKPAWFKFVQQNTNWVANATVYAVVRNVSERATTEVHAVIADLAFAIQRDWQVDRNDALTWAWNIVHLAEQAGWVTLYKTSEMTLVKMTSRFAFQLYENNAWGMAGCFRPPMVERPRPHRDSRPGGYHNPQMRRGISHGSWKELASAPRMILTMNRMMFTKWHISQEMLSIAKEVFALPEVIVDHRRDRYGHDTTLAMAEQFSGVEFYNPTYADVSGRIYYECDLLSPQGNDLARGLLHGTDHALTDKGWFWLAVHVANSFSGIGGVGKLDKTPYKDRVKWTHKNSDTLCLVAEDPMRYMHVWFNGIGKGAGSFQALAALLAWRRAKDTGRCCLHVRLDQTTSNYGIKGGLLRDQQLCELTNMVPSSEVQDMHSVTATNLMGLLADSDYSDFTTMIAGTPDKPNRKFVKSPSMVSGYGGTTRGIAQSLFGKREWAFHDNKWKKVAEEGSIPDLVSGDDPRHQFKVAMDIASMCKEAVEITAPGAFKVMRYLKEVVKVARKKKMEKIMWYSPSGKLIVLHPRKRGEQMIVASSEFGGASLKWHPWTDETNWRKMATAISPRWIQPIDASLLHIAGSMFRHEFAGVHDCIQCHPNQMGKFLVYMRKAMYMIMESNPLVKFCEQFGITVEQGDWDTKDCLKANPWH